MYSLLQDLSYGTIIFDLLTLTLKFELLLKKFNLYYYLVMVATRRASLSSDNSYYAPRLNDRCHIVFILFVSLELYNWHECSTIDVLYNDTKVFDSVTLNLTFALNVTFSEFFLLPMAYHIHISFNVNFNICK